MDPSQVIPVQDVPTQPVQPVSTPVPPVATPEPAQPVQVNNQAIIQVNAPVVEGQIPAAAPVATVINEVVEAPKVMDVPNAPKPTSFITYLFQFIILGITSIGKHGFEAFNPNIIIDSTDNNVDPNKKVAANAKALEKIELRKQNIRNNPKYIEMKAKLQADLAASAGQKFEEPVVFKYIAMTPEGKIVSEKFNGVSIFLYITLPRITPLIFKNQEDFLISIKPFLNSEVDKEKISKYQIIVSFLYFSTNSLVLS